MKIKAIACAIFVSSVALSGCVSTARTNVDSQTHGQQLLDLKKAYDAGVISKAEYEKKRQAILRK